MASHANIYDVHVTADDVFWVKNYFLKVSNS